ncbi:unnamed protein product [Leptidea sinapis]|uniref:Cytochrome P450 n=1 Tax=Leptidea sinapis TaxID=189913 RepID=A0A5E4Q3N9_9NEOP|nr:unnamed protein product [Leptidea sinapis]
MLVNRIRLLYPSKGVYNKYCGRMLKSSVVKLQTPKTLEINVSEQPKDSSLPSRAKSVEKPVITLPTQRVVPMILNKKEPIVLPFDDVPGPKSLKYLSIARYYLSQIGTQITTRLITFGLNVGTYMRNRKSTGNLSVLFDEYGPVVRFVSPVGRDIVLINHPEHIQKVFTLEGDHPIRSTIESLEKYRVEHRNHVYSGIFTVQGQEWFHQRCLVKDPLQTASAIHAQSIYDLCDRFTQKVYSTRNYQDEVSKDFYKQIHKWAFDCMGLVIFSKKFTMIDTELVNSQCDMSWMYHNLEKATEAIIKCESGLRWWKITPTPVWLKLTKHCENLDNLIGKYVLAANKEIQNNIQDIDKSANPTCLIDAILLCDNKLTVEDISTIVMDMLLIGVNTIASATSYLLYFVAKHQKAQRQLYEEIEHMYGDLNTRATHTTTHQIFHKEPS